MGIKRGVTEPKYNFFGANYNFFGVNYNFFGVELYLDLLFKFALYFELLERHCYISGGSI